MAAVTTKKLKMVFSLSSGTTKTYMLDNPKDSIDAETVAGFMGDVVEKTAVKAGTATVTGAKSASIVTTTIDPLF